MNATLEDALNRTPLRPEDASLILLLAAAVKGLDETSEALRLAEPCEPDLLALREICLQSTLFAGIPRGLNVLGLARARFGERWPEGPARSRRRARASNSFDGSTRSKVSPFSKGSLGSTRRSRSSFWTSPMAGCSVDQPWRRDSASLAPAPRSASVAICDSCHRTSTGAYAVGRAQRRSRRPWTWRTR